MVELSTDEVIMNNAVVPHAESSRPDLYVAVLGTDGAPQRGPIPLSKKTYTVALINPGDALPDVQYAIETTEGASFVGGGCEGNRRTHGRLTNDSGRDLVIYSLDKEIRVVAAWAGGHEAVQLTEELVFVPDMKQQFLEDRKEEKVEVEGIQVVEKDEPHDVEAVKVDEVGIFKQPKEGEKAAELAAVEEETADEPAEDAHKAALDAEIQVLREEVHELGKENEPERNKEEKQKETIDLQNKKNELDDTQKDRIQRFKDIYKQRHGDKRRDEEKHNETIKRFKDAYKERHVGEKEKEKIRPKAEDGSLREAAIKRFKEAYKKKHGTEDKLHHHEPQREVLKRKEDLMKKKIQDALHHRSNGDVTWRKHTPISFVERVKRRYHKGDDNPVDMRYYLYGVIFFVVANVTILQLCFWLGKRDKGRRDL